MAINHKRRQTNIANRNWGEHTEKQNAQYMAKQLRDLGYKVPNYMKKGEINQQQIENYSNRIMNKLEKMNEEQRLRKLSPGERRREKRDNIQKEIDNENYKIFMNTPRKPLESKEETKEEPKAKSLDEILMED